MNEGKNEPEYTRLFSLEKEGWQPVFLALYTYMYVFNEEFKIHPVNFI